MMRNVKTKEAIARLAKEFTLKKRAIEILGIVVSEWENDSMSTQCFDLRIVNEAKSVCKQLNELTND